MMPSDEAPYSGPERRRHRVYVTQHHEYHCKDGVCVAVRDVHTGAFLPGHAAIGRVACGAIRLRPDGGIASILPPENALPGVRMHFALNADDRRDVLTSALREVGRPPRDVVATYELD
jgi:hypothetical protein